jgi:hypothetical protein
VVVTIRSVMGEHETPHARCLGELECVFDDRVTVEGGARELVAGEVTTVHKYIHTRCER